VTASPAASRRPAVAAPAAAAVPAAAVVPASVPSSAIAAAAVAAAAIPPTATARGCACSTVVLWTLPPLLSENARDLSPLKVHQIQALLCVLCVPRVRKFHEANAPNVSCVVILWQVYIPHNAELLSLILDIINACGLSQISQQQAAVGSPVPPHRHGCWAV